ncbi:MAG: phytoene desaturase family protein, partial [Candidatus Helarchaeota archaeon]
MSSQEYDVIIIGSGMAGLTCGCILAKNGLKTLILEKHSIPGGYCTTFKRKPRGKDYYYKFDASLHMINGCESGGMTYEALKKTGVKISYYKSGEKVPEIAPDEVCFIPINETFHSIYLNLNQDFASPSNLDELQELLNKKFPKYVNNLKSFFKEIRQIIKFVNDFNNSSKLGKIKTCLFRLPTVLKFFNANKKSARDLLDKHDI